MIPYIETERVLVLLDLSRIYMAVKFFKFCSLFVLAIHVQRAFIQKAIRNTLKVVLNDTLNIFFQVYEYFMIYSVI